jgi:formate hydrogenlyase subunit 3/multisubunit Na+/H+ antiporter MnhD subunit
MLIGNNSWMLCLIVAPLLLGLAVFLTGGKWSSWLGLAATVSVAMGAVVVSGFVFQQGPQFSGLSGWPTPLGIRLSADGLSCVMLLMSASVGALVSVYAIRLFQGRASCAVLAAMVDAMERA